MKYKRRHNFEKSKIKEVMGRNQRGIYIVKINGVSWIKHINTPEDFNMLLFKKYLNNNPELKQEFESKCLENRREYKINELLNEML